MSVRTDIPAQSPGAIILLIIFLAILNDPPQMAHCSATVRILRDRGETVMKYYVPVVGWDESYIFIAESFRNLSNCEEGYYNRKVTIEEFKRLWNTAGWKMPLYRNTYITAIKSTTNHS